MSSGSGTGNSLPPSSANVGGGANPSSSSVGCTTGSAPHPPAGPTQAERDLAKKPGTSPEQRAAREKVARDFYHGKDGLGDVRCEADLKGIDLDQPVEVVDFPPPETMQQYVRKGAKKPGNFFDPIGGQSGDSLGLNDDPAIRESKTFKSPKGQGLLSTAAPIVDNWTDKNKAVMTKGGGKQMVVDGPTRDAFTGA